MALSVNSIFEINSGATANNVNAGYFNPANTNMATDLACDTGTGNTNSPVVSSASYNFVAGDVGHWVYIKSGTNWTPGWYKIASVASNKATLTANIGTAIQVDSTVGYPTPMYKTNTVAGCATVGTPTGGTWTIDYSQTTACRNSTTTDLASTNGTTNPSAVTSASFTFGVNTIGNGIHITSGTSWTQGWYEIVSVSGGAATLDRAVGSAATLSSGTWRIGGALSLNSTLDDDLFELGLATNGTGAMRFFIKSGSYTFGETVSIAATGGTQAPIVVEGYYQYRGDKPTMVSGNQPYFNSTAFPLVFAANWDMYNVTFANTGTASVTLGAGGKLINCRISNFSTTTTRAALSAAGAGNIIIGCEFNSMRGYGVTSGVNAYFDANIFRSCISGFRTTGGNLYYTFNNNIFEGCTSSCILITTAALTGMLNAVGNTFISVPYSGIGIDAGITGSRNIRVINNIFTKFSIGIDFNESFTVTDFYSDYNDYYDNTTDVLNGLKGINDISVNPSFTSYSTQIGTTATSSTNVLTDSGANFTGIVDDYDYVLIYSITGTGGSAGAYPIHSHTSTTLTIATPDNQAINLTTSGSGSNIIYAIITGHNYSVGTGLKALGYPGNLPQAYTTSYTDIGAAQRQEAGASGGSSHVFGG